MKRTEQVIARGTGTWDKPYDLAVIIERSTYTNRAATGQRTTSAYIIEFCCSEKCNKRRFPSEQSLWDFVNRSFSDLKLEAIREPSENPVPHLLMNLADTTLKSVKFVMSYGSLVFDQYCFNFFFLPNVVTSAATFRPDHRKYGEVLKSLVGKRVCMADEYLDTGLTFIFEDGAEIRVPLGSDYSLPEVAEVSSAQDGWLRDWQTGEEPFWSYAHQSNDLGKHDAETK
jgi:hypothetical protein